MVPLWKPERGFRLRAEREVAEMSQENERGQFRILVNVAALGLVAAIVVLTATFLVPRAQAEDKIEDFTRVFGDAYDEVSQASHYGNRSSAPVRGGLHCSK